MKHTQEQIMGDDQPSKEEQTCNLTITIIDELTAYKKLLISEARVRKDDDFVKYNMEGHAKNLDKLIIRAQESLWDL